MDSEGVKQLIKKITKKKSIITRLVLWRSKGRGGWGKRAGTPDLLIGNTILC